jgi:hypothetical protein
MQTAHFQDLTPRASFCQRRSGMYIGCAEYPATFEQFPLTPKTFESPGDITLGITIFPLIPELVNWSLTENVFMN